MAKSKEKKKETEQKSEQPPRLVIMGDDPLAQRVAGWYLSELRKAGRQEDSEKVEQFIKDANAYDG